MFQLIELGRDVDADDAGTLAEELFGAEAADAGGGAGDQGDLALQLRPGGAGFELALLEFPVFDGEELGGAQGVPTSKSFGIENRLGGVGGDVEDLGRLLTAGAEGEQAAILPDGPTRRRIEAAMLGLGVTIEVALVFASVSGDLNFGIVSDDRRQALGADGVVGSERTAAGRPLRTPMVEWFPEEALDPELDVGRIAPRHPIDLLVSHDSPLTEAVRGAHAAFAARFPVDGMAEAYTANCNARYLELVERLRPKQIVHGHQHQSYVEDWRGIRVFGLIHLQGQRHGQVLLSWEELQNGTWKNPEAGVKS